MARQGQRDLCRPAKPERQSIYDSAYFGRANRNPAPNLVSHSPPLSPPPSSTSYSWSEVIHRAGDESIFSAFERERPRIVNNFAASALSGYELSSSSEKMNLMRLWHLVVVLSWVSEYADEDESSLETITSGYKEFASV